MILNGADYAPFNLYGVGVFMAHSGLGAYKNNTNCAAFPNYGPTPPGKYWIIDRKEGNWLSQKKAEVHDWLNSRIGRHEFGRTD